ncbi:Alpha/Beta hydrolase protein [Echria macrotheca]|uniref:Alpha/Beta hydrolase protein n=1 Tax=Echria macrotheca TaxID=438768 RepID=A0AAJ0F6D5_9PEZI|nr:Alpha/Beta hydrolase protein [Echria macrotheca]
MAILELSGASLYYEKKGHGPLLLLIPGANGDGDIFGPVSEHLSTHFTVVTYDRRGFSRSLLRGAQDYQNRLKTDADDAKSLIEHLADQPATIFGNSSGAIVALTVLSLYPSIVRAVISHEAPAIRLFPDGGAEWRSFFQHCYDTYRREGVAPAMELFASRLAEGAEAAAMRQAMDPANGGHVPSNTMYWFERELLDYTEVELDLEELMKQSSKLVLAYGVEIRPRSLYRPNVEVLADRLNLDVLELPGGHVGYVFYPEEFAQALAKKLKQYM